MTARTEAEYLERCGEADGLLVQYGAVTRRVLEGLPRVRVLVRYGVGVDGIDLAAATDHGVPVVNVPDYGTDEVANHAVALLLALARKIARLDRQTRSGGWDVFRVGPVTRLAGQTVGIVGCGRIGSAVARKLGGFDVRLLGCDPNIEHLPAGCAAGGLRAAARRVGLRHHPLPPDGRDPACLRRGVPRLDATDRRADQHGARAGSSTRPRSSTPSSRGSWRAPGSTCSSRSRSTRPARCSGWSK